MESSQYHFYDWAKWFLLPHVHICDYKYPNTKTMFYPQIVLKGLTNEVSKKIPANNVEDIMYAGTGKLLLREADGVTLFDLQQRK